VSLIQLNGIVKSYGGRRILDGLDFDLVEGARIGVIGPNGGGKSTLLRILAGVEDADAGHAARRRELTVAWLPQHVEGDERTPLETVIEARPDLRELERELHAVAERIGELAGDLDRMTRALARQEELLERWTRAGGPGFEGRCRAHLAELGVTGAEHDVELPTSALSGGQRKLVALARCLAADPDVLILDEPESHLDAERRAGLERLIRDFDGAVVAVSHDRYLLDETVSTIAELDRGRIRLWPGCNYSAYATARELELLRQQQLYVTQQKEIARMEEAIRRFEHWAHIVIDERHAKAARSMQKRLDKLEKIERPVLERRKIALRLHPHERGGQRIVDLRSVSMEFDGNPVLIGADLTVLRGERVGVVGPNGAGKSVLLKLIVGEHEPTDGEVWRGPSIRVGYLSQSPEASFAGKTVLEVVRANHRCTEGEAVSLLLKFLFDYEQTRRQATTLSGGELTRLHLLLLMLSGANCLVLDEPTNHLDIDSVEMLERALEEFDGTAIFTSHDRYFLDRIADRIVEVTGRAGEARPDLPVAVRGFAADGSAVAATRLPGDGSLVSHEGGYSSWFESRRGSSPVATSRLPSGLS
jgi:ATP-binding cassette, subfamily F, member 3